MVLEDIPNALGDSAAPAQTVSDTALALVNDPGILIVGVVLIIATVLLVVFLKRLLVNSVLGLVAWGFLTFILHIELPFWASLIVTLIFGLAGLGVMLVLRFLGIV